MRYVLIAVSTLALVGCSTTNAMQQEANAELTKRIGERLRYCGITGNIDAGIGGIALGGTGAATSFNLNCPASPWPTPSEPPGFEVEN
jgi:hypothetical protein